MTKKPYHLSKEISEMGTGMRYVGIKNRDPEHYWITCCMDYTGIMFATWVARDLMIDSDSQDMISQIDQVNADRILVRTSTFNFFISQAVIGNWIGRERGKGRGKVE